MFASAGSSCVCYNPTNSEVRPCCKLGLLEADTEMKFGVQDVYWGSTWSDGRIKRKGLVRGRSDTALQVVETLARPAGVLKQASLVRASHIWPGCSGPYSPEWSVSRGRLPWEGSDLRWSRSFPPEANSGRTGEGGGVPAAEQKVVPWRGTWVVHLHDCTEHPFPVLGVSKERRTKGRSGQTTALLLQLFPLICYPFQILTQLQPMLASAWARSSRIWGASETWSPCPSHIPAAEFLQVPSQVGKEAPRSPSVGHPSPLRLLLAQL